MTLPLQEFLIFHPLKDIALESRSSGSIFNRPILCAAGWSANDAPRHYMIILTKWNHRAATLFNIALITITRVIAAAIIC